MFGKTLVIALVGLTTVGAVNYQPPSEGNVLQVLCPDSSTLQLALNASTAPVYAAYVASQNTWPATMFFVNNATVATDTQCSPPQSFSAFQINEAGSLDTDGTTYTITNFVQLSVAEATAAMDVQMQQALIPAEVEAFANLQNVYNGASGSNLAAAFSQSLQVPEGYMDALWAMGNITQALTTQASENQILATRGAPALGGLASSLTHVAIMATIIFVSIRLVSAEATFKTGGSGKVTELQYPSTYILPWFVMGGATDGSGDGDGPRTCVVTGSSGSNDPFPSIDIKKPGACKVSVKNLKITRSTDVWAFDTALDIIQTNIGLSSISATLVMICTASGSLTEGTALTGSFQQVLYTTESDDTGTGNAGGSGKDGGRDDECDPLTSMGSAFPEIGITPYLNLAITESYNVLGYGELNMDFIVHFPSTDASFENVAIKSDGSNPDDNKDIISIMGPASEPFVEITRLAASINTITANLGLTVGVGVKTIVNEKEVLDVGLTTGPVVKLVGSGFGITVNGGNGTTNSTSTADTAQGTGVPTIKARKTGFARRDDAITNYIDSDGINAEACNQEVTVRAGYETWAVVKVQKQVLKRKLLRSLTNIMVKTSAIVKCAAPWIFG